MSRPYEDLFYDDWGLDTSSENLRGYIDTLAATVNGLKADAWTEEHFRTERLVMEEQIRLMGEELVSREL